MLGRQTQIEVVRVRMSLAGYRSVTEADITPGQTLARVDVEKFHASAAVNMEGVTHVLLHDEPLQEEGGVKKVLHYCNPASAGDCLVPLDEILREEYVPGNMRDNKVRWFARAL